jgi:hypothetical protein
MRRLTCICGRCHACLQRAWYRRKQMEKRTRLGLPHPNYAHRQGAAIVASENRFEEWAAKQRAVWDQESGRLREWIAQVKREAATVLPEPSA